MLRLEGVTKRFGGLTALDGVGFAVTPGSITALIGPNGAGKSTLLDCLFGVRRVDAGSIRLGEHELTMLPTHAIVRLGLARTFQNLRLAPHETVLDNVLAGLVARTPFSLTAAILRLPAARHAERACRLAALEALDRLGLAAKARWPAGVLSYGDKKRLELARALVADPLVLVLDEPVAGLNRAETETVEAELVRLRRAGRTVLLVEHDMDMVMRLVDQVVVLDGGRRIAVGTPAQVQRNPLVLEAYLGQMEVVA
jgi:ABC-type branched-subunit amino acid transport system ATPase component